MAQQFPLSIRFKLVALAPRMFVTDSQGQNVAYVSQKVLALKEDITVFADESRSRELFKIKADRVMDFTTTYHFTESGTGRSLGAIKSKGWKSIWRSTYEVTDSDGNVTFTIREDNPWVKIGDAILGEVPFLGMLTGFFLNPKYSAINTATEQPVMTITKQPAFFEGLFNLEKMDNSLSTEDEQRLLLSFMLMVQFMRRRG